VEWLKKNKYTLMKCWKLYFPIVALFALIIAIKYFEKSGMTTVYSSLDKQPYLIRKSTNNKLKAANQLAKNGSKVKLLVEHLGEFHGENEGVKRLGKFKGVFQEVSPQQIHNVAYSENKGDTIALCLRDKKTNKNVSENALYFVTMHELAHVMTKEYKHNEVFWENMKFLLKVSEEIGLYVYKDYSKQPQVFCGTVIKSSPYVK
jgi:hypothetical protein